MSQPVWYGSNQPLRWGHIWGCGGRGTLELGRNPGGGVSSGRAGDEDVCSRRQVIPKRNLYFVQRVGFGRSPW